MFSLHSGVSDASIRNDGSGLEVRPESGAAFERSHGPLAALRSARRSYCYASVARLASEPWMTLSVLRPTFRPNL